jgi:hypothetical protein
MSRFCYSPLPPITVALVAKISAKLLILWTGGPERTRTSNQAVMSVLPAPERSIKFGNFAHRKIPIITLRGTYDAFPSWPARSGLTRVVTNCLRCLLTSILVWLRRFIGHSLVNGALRLRTFWVRRRFSGLEIIRASRNQRPERSLASMFIFEAGTILLMRLETPEIRDGAREAFALGEMTRCMPITLHPILL